MKQVNYSWEIRILLTLITITLDQLWKILNLFQWNKHNGDINSKNVETITENFPVIRLSNEISNSTISLLGM